MLEYLAKYKKFRNNESKATNYRFMLMSYDNPKTKKEEKAAIVKKLFEETFTSFAHFERYTQPSNLQGSKLVQNEKEHPSKIDQQQLSIETFLQKGPTCMSSYNELSDHIIHRIPIKEMHTAPLEIVRKFL